MDQKNVLPTRILFVICFVLILSITYISRTWIVFQDSTQNVHGHRIKATNDEQYIFNRANVTWDSGSSIFKLLTRASFVKVYVLESYRIDSSSRSIHPGSAFQCPTSSPLYPIRSWLWVHNEYAAIDYIESRLQHDFLLRTSTLSDAELCYPVCHDNDKKPSTSKRISSSQYIEFQVVPGLEYKWSYCSFVGIYFESNSEFKRTKSPRCIVSAPYFHSIYQPTQICTSNTGISPKELMLLPPWQLSVTRHVLLAFYGGVWRGKNRVPMVNEMMHISSADSNLIPGSTSNSLLKLSKGYKHRNMTLFSAPYVFSNHSSEDGVWGKDYFYMRAWELYLSSVFSWHPNGDSPTRRAFYDAWMFGSIPVVTKTAAFHYQSIFGGLLYSTTSSLNGLHFEDIVVVFEDNFFTDDALSIIKYLYMMSEEEIEIRRHRMSLLAPYLQWGWCNECTPNNSTSNSVDNRLLENSKYECSNGDSLRLSLTSFMTDHRR